MRVLEIFHEKSRQNLCLIVVLIKGIKTLPSKASSPEDLVFQALPFEWCSPRSKDLGEVIFLLRFDRCSDLPHNLNNEWILK